MVIPSSVRTVRMVASSFAAVATPPARPSGAPAPAISPPRAPPTSAVRTARRDVAPANTRPSSPARPSSIALLHLASPRRGGPAVPAPVAPPYGGKHGTIVRRSGAWRIEKKTEPAPPSGGQGGT